MIRTWNCAGLWMMIAAAVLMPACGGGGGGGGGPTQPPANPPAANFTTAGEPPDNAVFLARGAGSSPTRLVLEVRVKKVEGLYGTSFDFQYPSGLLSFNAAESTEGPFLSRNGGVRTEMLVVEDSPGNLVIGLSRLGLTGGRTGTGLLLRLTFDTRASGSGSFSFDRNLLISPDGRGHAGVTWVGGSVQVTV